jgi:hypothetical protein
MLLSFVFKCINGLCPSTVTDLITLRNVEANLLVEPNFQSSYGRRSFSYCAPKYWNCLPLNIRTSDNLTSFKRMTKYLLFNNFNTYVRDVYKYVS